MRVRIMTLLSALLLASCGTGDGEDFTVEVKRPMAVVYAPLSSADVREARYAFQGMTIERTRPGESEILYTIPGTGDFPSTIRLRLEPTRGGEATVVHASVHVPAVHATIDGQEKVLSEHKVASILQDLLMSTGRSLEMGSDAQADTVKLSGFLAGIAIATNKAYLAQALQFKGNPQKLVDVLMASGLDNDLSQSLAAGRDSPTVDPDAGERQHDLAQAKTDWQQQDAADKAAAPANDLDHYEY